MNGEFCKRHFFFASNGMIMGFLLFSLFKWWVRFVELLNRVQQMW